MGGARKNFREASRSEKETQLGKGGIKGILGASVVEGKGGRVGPMHPHISWEL